MSPDDQPIADMNTTPLIDVMLVLLIMFIITIPMQTHSVPIDLPAPSDGPTVDTERNKVTIDGSGTVAWNGSAVSLSLLRGLLTRSAAMDPQPELQLQPAPEARYELVDEVLATVRRARVERMGFVGNENYGQF
jgi:biopolymer transport protein ExbD